MRATAQRYSRRGQSVWIDGCDQHSRSSCQHRRDIINIPEVIDDRHSRARFNSTLVRCRRANGSLPPQPPLHARTVRATTKIVQTATGEERGMQRITSRVGVTEITDLQGPADETGTMIPKGVRGGLLRHRRGLHESQGIRGPSRPRRGEDGRVPALGPGQDEWM